MRCIGLVCCIWGVGLNDLILIVCIMVVVIVVILEWCLLSFG